MVRALPWDLDEWNVSQNASGFNREDHNSVCGGPPANLWAGALSPSTLLPKHSLAVQGLSVPRMRAVSACTDNLAVVCEVSQGISGTTLKIPIEQFLVLFSRFLLPRK